MDCTEVCVLEQTHKVGLSSLLQGKDSRALETQISLEVLCDFSHKALKGQLANEELCRLLVLANFTEGNRSRAIAMGLLNTA